MMAARSLRRTNGRSNGRKAGVGRALAGALLVVVLAAACGDDGPTGPKPASLPELFGTELYRVDGSTVGVESLAGTPVIGIYFASAGCPACGAFTPILLDAYDGLKEEGRAFEVVLVTGGIGMTALLEYMTDSGMPWLAVPTPSEEITNLVRRYDVRWVPTLIVIDSEGRVRSMNGREDVTVGGAGAYDLWLAAASGS
jgi:nucleoredoxin